MHGGRGEERTVAIGAAHCDCDGRDGDITRLGQGRVDRFGEATETDISNRNFS